MDNNEKILQYRFTAYLMKSIKTYKTKYIRKNELQQRIETLVEDFDGISLEYSDDFTDDDSLFKNLQNTALDKALDKIKARDFRILMLHLLEDYSLKEISSLLGINHKTVITIYERTIKKIKREMGEDKHES